MLCGCAELATEMPHYTQTGLHCNRNNNNSKVRQADIKSICTTYVCVCVCSMFFCHAILFCLLTLRLELGQLCWRCASAVAAVATAAGWFFSISSFFSFCTLFNFEIWICRLHTVHATVRSDCQGSNSVGNWQGWGRVLGEPLQLHLGSINASEALRSTHSSSESWQRDLD